MDDTMGTWSAQCPPVGRRDLKAHVPDRPYRSTDSAGDLGASRGAQPVGNGDLGDAPALGGGAEHHLQRPPEAAVCQVEFEQRGPAPGAHRAQIAESCTGPAPQLEGEGPVGEARVHRPGSRLSHPCSEAEIGVPRQHRVGD
jgi:hypothetical protein